MKIVLAAIVVGVAAGCASTPPSGGDAMAERVVAYTCDNNESLSVRFVPARDSAILTRGGESIELKSKPGDWDFVYGNGPNTISGRGDDLTVQIGRMVPIECTKR